MIIYFGFFKEGIMFFQKFGKFYRMSLWFFKDKAVTSMESELGRKLDMEEVSSVLKENLATLFDFSYTV